MNRFLFTALLLLGFASPTRADLLFSNLSQSDNGSSGFNAAGDLLATDFLTDGTPWSITSLTANLENSGLVTHTVTFSIYTDSGGTPDALLAAFDTPASIVPGGNLGTATSAGINLQANTPYWVVGQVDATGPFGTVSWRFTFSEATDGSPFTTVPTTPLMSNGGLVWIPSDSGNFRFTLEGTPIPEPSTLPGVLTAGAVGAFGWWRRRRVALGLAS